MASQRPGVLDLYFIGFAGSSEQDVFQREVGLVRQLLDQRFDTKDRSLLFINSHKTVRNTPLATRSGLDWALYYLADIMDPDEDILFLYLTSHGSRNHYLSADLPDLPINWLNADDMKDMLDRSGIKWRVIVISACYAGGFIDTLKDENTLIITASRKDRQSFGCANGLDYTYFGQAYFDEALRERRSFIDAFELAKNNVTAREQSEGFDPSHPQIFVGRNIRYKLAILEDRLRREN